jgi:hypothetical protein
MVSSVLVLATTLALKSISTFDSQWNVKYSIKNCINKYKKLVADSSDFRDSSLSTGNGNHIALAALVSTVRRAR